MSMKKMYIIFGVLVFIVLGGLGCVSIGTAPQGSDGGVFKSSDKGETWAQSNAVPTAKGIGNLNGIAVANLVFDPQDNKAIYLGSAGSGLFYTWDAGDNWKYAENLGVGNINSVAIAYNNKCTIYIAAQNKILKTIDCARSWQNQYFDTRPNVYVSYLAVNPLNSDTIYAGLSTGDLLRSADKGESWAIINRFNNKIQKIYIHPKTAGLIFVALQNDGLWKSADSGKSWADLRQKMGQFSGSNEVYDVDFDKDGKTIYLTSNFGIIVSEDSGASWRKIDLLTPPNGAKIYSLAINPNNSKEIYYSTASTFYSSFDGGKNWITKKLLTSRAGVDIMVDPENSNIIYLGTRKLN